jgi:hypothetical protein
METAAQATSRYLTSKELRALERLGDLLFPRYGEFPSFSELGCVAYVDDILKNAPESELNQLKGFLGFLAYMPTAVLRAVLWFARNAHRFPEPLATQARLMDLGLRGALVTLYFSGKHAPRYSGPTTLQLIGYTPNIVKK